MQEAQAAIDLATTERDMLTRRQRDAEAALQTALSQLDAAKAGAKAKEKRIAELKEAMAGSRWGLAGLMGLMASPACAVATCCCHPQRCCMSVCDVCCCMVPSPQDAPVRLHAAGPS
jgi:hypothetical protein